MPGPGHVHRFSMAADADRIAIRPLLTGPMGPISPFPIIAGTCVSLVVGRVLGIKSPTGPGLGPDKIAVTA